MVVRTDAEVSACVLGEDGSGVSDVDEDQSVVWSLSRTDREQCECTGAARVAVALGPRPLEELFVQVDAALPQRRVEVERVEAREQVRVQLFFEEVAAVGPAVAVVNSEQTATGEACLDEIVEPAMIEANLC